MLHKTASVVLVASRIDSGDTLLNSDIYTYYISAVTSTLPYKKAQHFCWAFFGSPRGIQIRAYYDTSPRL